MNSSVALDREHKKLVSQIENMECDLFYARLRLAGLISVEEAILRQMITDNEEDKPSDQKG